MAYTGWLSFGGNELLNTPRAVGISQSAACPAFWLKENWCLSLRAVLGDAPYVHENVRFAPWFDPANAEVSSRFYGAYGIDIEGLEDSTRQVQKTEGIRSGGVIGRTRKAMRPVRVRAVLLADGDDALEYGRAWLEAALDPGACGQHGGECGTTDVEYFATCPPLRGIVDYFSPWSVAAENLFTNPNLVGSGSVEVYRNLFTNPNLVGSGTWAEVRRNRFKEPTPATSATYQVSRGSATFLPDLGGNYVRLTVTELGTSYFNLVAAGNRIPASPGESIQYRLQARIGAAATGVYLRMYAVNAGGVVIAQIGADTPLYSNTEWVDIEITRTMPDNTAFAGLYVLGGAGSPVGSTVDIRKVYAGAAGAYLDGSTKPADLIQPEDFRTRWLGAENASESVLEIETVRGLSASNCVVGVSTWEGERAARIIPTSASSNDSYVTFYVAPTGFAGTAMGTVHLKAPLTGSIKGDSARTLTASAPWTNLLPTAPNVAGSYPRRLIFDARTGSAQIRINNGGSLGSGDVWWTDIGLFAGTYNGPWFSGDASPDSDLTASWSGPVDNSTSVLSGVPVAGVSTNESFAIRSSRFGGSMRLIPTGSNNSYAEMSPRASIAVPITRTGIASRSLESPLTGPLNTRALGLRMFTPESWVLSPNVAGTVNLRLTSFQDTSVGSGRLIFMHGGAQGSGDVYWSMPGLFAGDYQGPWFAGDTENTELNRYSWAGAANASASIWESRVPLQRPQTDEEWAASIDDVRRFLHGVAATSGPFTLKEMRKGRHVGQLVEFTLTAERPWVHGVTRAVELPTTQTSVIEDVRYNLTPHPSMELSSGVVVLSRNLATNPSVETNDTGWSAAAAASTGSAPSSFLTSGRSVELAAVGAASYRARLLGSGSPVASGRAQLEAQQSVQLGSLPARSRVSVRIWGALIQSAGGAGTSLVSLQMIAQWRTAGGADISSEYTPLATTALNGRAFELRGLLPPSNATQVRVILRGTVDWVSSATPALNSDIRLYADALAVTTP